MFCLRKVIFCYDSIQLTINNYLMNLKTLTLCALLSALILASPLILLSKENHQPIVNSQQIAAYLQERLHSRAFQINSHVSQVKAELQSLDIEKERISSFLSSLEKKDSLKMALASQNVHFQEIQLNQLSSILKSNERDVVISVRNTQRPGRVLQGGDFDATNTTQVNSKIFNNITTYSLSGLWVGLFLLVMLGIAISCLFNLKTNDRFARQHLWVGRQS